MKTDEEKTDRAGVKQGRQRSYTEKYCGSEAVTDLNMHDTTDTEACAYAFTKKRAVILKGAAVSLLLWHHLFSAEGDITGSHIHLHFLSVHQLANSGIAARVCVWLFIFISAYGWTLQFKPSASYADRSFIRYSICFVKNRWLKLMLVTLPFIVFLVEKIGLFAAPAVFVLSQTVGESLMISRYGYKYSAYTMIVVFGVIAARYNVFQRIGHRIRMFCQNHPVRERMVKNAVWIGPAVPAMILLFLIYKYLYSANKGTVYGMLMGIAALLLAEAACFFPERVSGPLLFLGKYSGDLFLAHGFILVQFRNVIYGTRNVFAAWGLLMAGSLVLCALLYAARLGERKLAGFLVPGAGN